MNISPENQESADRDRFIMSKGHSVGGFIMRVLAREGIFPKR